MVDSCTRAGNLFFKRLAKDYVYKSPYTHCSESYRNDASGNRSHSDLLLAVARHFGGEFLLRIEDTDRERSTPEATQVILDAMKWLNLDYDNKEVVYQMNRLPRYKEVVDQLLAKGLAYKCYATKEELDEMREAQKARGEKPRYDGRWRPENCVGKPIPEGVTPVIRFRNPDEGVVSWEDGVYGEITVANS